MPDPDSVVTVETVTEELPDEESQAEQQTTAETAEETGAAEETAEAEAADDDGAVVISIGDEQIEAEEPERAPSWVRDLRKANREKEKRIRELEAQLKGSAPAQPAALGEKPTLKDCDYDEEVFAEKLGQWHTAKARQEAEQAKAREAQESAQREWNSRLQHFATKKAALKVPDFEDAEEAATSALSQTQLALLVKGADDPALIVYALGKSPKLAREMAAITDPVHFAWRAAKLEEKVKITRTTKTAPAPERKISGGKPGIVAGNVRLDEAIRKARDSGDYNRVLELKRQQQKKA